MKLKILILFSVLVLLSVAVYAGTSTYLIGVAGVVASGGGTPVLKDSNTAAWASRREVGRYTDFLYTGGNWVAGSSYTLSSAKVFLSRTGTATGTLTLHLWATSSGAPTGSPIDSSNTVNRSTIPTSETAIEFIGFDYSIVNGTEYCFILQSSEINGDEEISFWFSANGDYTREQYNDANGTPPFSVDQAEAVKFETYGY